MRRRDELAVVGELALDEAGGEAGAAHLEGGVAIAEAHGDVLAATDQALQFVERTTGHQHLLIGGQHLLPDQIANRQPVAVGGNHAQAVALGGHHHPGEDGPRFVGAGGTHDLPQRIAELGRRQGDRGVDR